MSKTSKGVIVTLIVLVLLVLVAVLGIASKGFTSWDFASWGQTITDWGNKFKDSFKSDNTTSALRILFHE